MYTKAKLFRQILNKFYMNKFNESHCNFLPMFFITEREIDTKHESFSTITSFVDELDAVRLIKIIIKFMFSAISNSN